MELKNFIAEEKDGIAILTVNRPEVRNAFNTECWGELNAYIDYIEHNDAIGALIITGAGPKAFVAGADVKGMEKRSLLDVLDGISPNTLKKLSSCNKPTIAAVNGYAFGGGCEIALACDIRIASGNAKMGLPELGLGIIPGAGGTQRLAKLVGMGRAKEIILTGRVVRADEALSIGLVTGVTTDDQLMNTAVETAKVIMSKGPLAVRLAKKAISASLSTDEETGMLLELLSYSVAFGSDDRREGTQAFIEKREAKFQGK